MKYLAIEFSNKYLNGFREPLEVMNNYIMFDKVEYYNKQSVELCNEYPLWMKHISGIVDGQLIGFVGSPKEAIDYIETNEFEYVFFSSMDSTVDCIKEVINGVEQSNTKFVVGNRNNFEKINNVILVNSMTDLNKMFNFNRDYKLQNAKTIKYKNAICNMADNGFLHRIYTTKGCNNNCKFCTNIEKASDLEYNEYANYIAITEGRFVYVGDLTFGQGIKSLNRLKNFYSIKDTNYIVQTTPKTIVDNLTSLHKWKDAGIRYVELGAETFNNDTLKELGKSNTVEQINIAIKYLNDIEIKVILNIMLNIKGETTEHFNNTLSAIEANFDKIHHLNIFNYTDYNSDVINDRSEILLIKSWNNTSIKIEEVKDFASKLYALNYKLLMKI